MRFFNLRLGRVVWAVDMTDVLGALEYSERKTGEEVASSEESSGGAQSESCVLPEEFADILELGHAVWLEDLLVHQFLEDALVLFAGVFRNQVDQGVEDALPGLILGLGVWDVGDRVTVFVSKGDLGDQLPANRIIPNFKSVFLEYLGLKLPGVVYLLSSLRVLLIWYL